MKFATSFLLGAALPAVLVSAVAARQAASVKQVSAEKRAAAVPRVVVDTRWNYLIGGYGKGWSKSLDARRWAREGESYAVFDGPRFLGLHQGKAGKMWGSECPESVTVKIALPLPQGPIKGLAPRGLTSEGIGISGLSAGQIARMRSRLPRELKAAPVYQNAVAVWLRARGIARPQVAIDKVWSVDLDNDGKREVLINAVRHRGKQGIPTNMQVGVQSGDYSLLLVRRVTPRGVQTVAIDSQVYPRDKADVVASMREMAAVLDLNGDGELEIVLRGLYYEGSWAEVYEWRGGRPKSVLQNGCGA